VTGEVSLESVLKVDEILHGESRRGAGTSCALSSATVGRPGAKTRHWSHRTLAPDDPSTELGTNYLASIMTTGWN